MQTRIHTQGFDATRPIVARVERQIGRNLRRFDREVMGIDIYLSGANGPRGGAEMKAKFDLLLREIQREIGDSSPQGLKAFETN